MIRPGTIGLVIEDYTFNIYERPIEKLTGDGHHAYICADAVTIYESHLGPGVTEQSLNKYFDGKSCSLLLVPKDTFSDPACTHVVHRARQEVGKGYDKIGLLAQKWRLFRRWASDERRICSELVAFAWWPYHKFMGKHYMQVTPHDILRDQLYCGFSHFSPIWLDSIKLSH